MQTHKYDIVVIGTGTAAQTAIYRLLRAGRSVAVVSREPMGGTCAMTGCQPKKYLVSHAEARASIMHLMGKGFDSLPKSDWKTLQSFKNEFTDSVPINTPLHLKEKGAGLYTGNAVFENETTIKVDNHTLLEAHRIILATGSYTRHSGIPGSENLLISDDFLNLKELPDSLLFLGGGYIGMEFAHVSAHMGSKVTVLHRGTRVMNQLDCSLSERLMAVSQKAGITIVTGESAKFITQNGDSLTATAHSGTEYKADKIFETIGRDPSLGILDGGRGNVESTRRGITVNKYQQSVSNPRVYAVGDCVDSPYQLATCADEEAKVAVFNILNDNREHVDYTVVPTSIFSIPNAASVGLTEDEARARGINFRVNEGQTGDWPSSKRIGDDDGYYKVMIDEECDHIIGVHLLRHHAADMINLFALAMKAKVPAPDLKRIMWAYPTLTSDIKYMVK